MAGIPAQGDPRGRKAHIAEASFGTPGGVSGFPRERHTGLWVEMPRGPRNRGWQAYFRATRI